MFTISDIKRQKGPPMGVGESQLLESGKVLPV